MPSERSPLRWDITRIFSLSCFFRIESIFRSNSMRFSRTNLLSNIFSSGSATISITSVTSVDTVIGVGAARAADVLLDEHVWSNDNWCWIDWHVAPTDESKSLGNVASMLNDDVAAILARCFGLLPHTSSVRSSFFEPKETSTTVELIWRYERKVNRTHRKWNELTNQTRKNETIHKASERHEPMANAK